MGAIAGPIVRMSERVAPGTADFTETSTARRGWWAFALFDDDRPARHS